MIKQSDKLRNIKLRAQKWWRNVSKRDCNRLTEQILLKKRKMKKVMDNFNWRSQVW